MLGHVVRRVECEMSMLLSRICHVFMVDEEEFGVRQPSDIVEEREVIFCLYRSIKKRGNAGIQRVADLLSLVSIVLEPTAPVQIVQRKLPVFVIRVCS